MKKLYILSIVNSIFLILGLNACTSEKYIREYSKDGFYHHKAQIYFLDEENNLQSVSGSNTDKYVLYSFSSDPLDYKEHLLKIALRKTGSFAENDMTYKVEVDKEHSSAREGVHYKKIDENELILKKGKIEALLPITILRDSLSTDKDEAIILTLNLIPSEDFETGIKSKNQIKIWMNNVLREPEDWEWFRGSFYWGEFSTLKYLKIIEEYGKLVAKNADDKGTEAKLLNALGEGWDPLNVKEAIRKTYLYFKEHPELKQSFDAGIERTFPYQQ